MIDSRVMMIQRWLEFSAGQAWLQVIVIIVFTLAVAKMAQWVVFGLVGRWARRTRTEIDDKLLEILRGPTFNTIVLAGLILATVRAGLGGTPRWATLAVLQTLLVLVWFLPTIRLSRLALSILRDHRDRFEMVQTRTLPLFENLAVMLIVGGAVYFFFLSWSIDVSAWVTSAGIIGIAVSFAARDTLANLFAGVFILADAPYKIGDFVILDSGERGRVTHIGLRSTRLLTRDDIEITIPNAVMGGSKIINETGGPHEKERIRVRISVAYGSDIDEVRDVLLAIAGSHQEICREPSPRVRFRSFENSGIVLELLCWISEPVLRGRLVDALNTEVYKTFQLRGIEIPYSKHDVFIKERTGE